MKSVYLTLTVGALALAGCDAANKAETSAANDAAATDAAAVETALKADETQWEKDYAARDVDKLAGHYADDAALAITGFALATDTAGRRSTIEKFVADPALTVTFASDRTGVAQSGDLAYTRGHYSTTSTDPATKQPKVENGSYLTVWRKQADGNWKAVEDFTTPGPPATN
jgi:ketosteroid isomerase-like protein